MNLKGLQEELEGKEDKNGVKKGGKGIRLVEFAMSSEERRKKFLGKDYDAMKAKYGWLYDQPINTSEDVEAKEEKEE